MTEEKNEKLGEELTEEELDQTTGGKLNTGSRYIKATCSNCSGSFWKLDSDTNTLCGTCKRAAATQHTSHTSSTPPPAVSL